MTSAELKYAVLWHWRFKRQAKFIATEFGGMTSNIRDVFVIEKNNVAIEFECKVSASDFKSDFKKYKHTFHRTRPDVLRITPMKFYFVIPDDLNVDESLLDPFPEYGVIRVKEAVHPKGAGLGNYADYTLEFQRHAEFLWEYWKDAEKRKGAVSGILRAVTMRMTSEIVGLHAKLLSKNKEATQ